MNLEQYLIGNKLDLTEINDLDTIELINFLGKYSKIYEVILSEQFIKHYNLNVSLNNSIKRTDLFKLSNNKVILLLNEIKLRHATHLEILNFNNNHINSNIIRKLIHSIKCNKLPELKILNLSRNNFTEDMIQNFSEAIPYLTKLESFEFAKNNLNDKELKLLIINLSTLSNLSNINFQSNNITYKGLEFIENLIHEQNISIHIKIDISNNNLISRIDNLPLNIILDNQDSQSLSEDCSISIDPRHFALKSDMLPKSSLPKYLLNMNSEISSANSDTEYDCDSMKSSIEYTSVIMTESSLANEDLAVPAVIVPLLTDFINIELYYLTIQNLHCIIGLSFLQKLEKCEEENLSILHQITDKHEEIFTSLYNSIKIITIENKTLIHDVITQQYQELYLIFRNQNILSKYILHQILNIQYNSLLLIQNLKTTSEDDLMMASQDIRSMSVFKHLTTEDNINILRDINSKSENILSKNNLQTVGDNFSTNKNTSINFIVNILNNNYKLINFIIDKVVPTKNAKLAELVSTMQVQFSIILFNLDQYIVQENSDLDSILNNIVNSNNNCFHFITNLNSTNYQEILNNLIKVNDDTLKIILSSNKNNSKDVTDNAIYIEPIVRSEEISCEDDEVTNKIQLEIEDAMKEIIEIKVKINKGSNQYIQDFCSKDSDIYLTTNIHHDPEEHTLLSGKIIALE